MTFLPSMENSGTCRRHRGSAHSGSHPAAAAPVRVRPPGAGQPGGLRAAGGRGPQGFCPEEPLSSRPEPEQVPPRAFSSPREGAGRLSCNKQWPPGPTPNSALLIPHPGDRQTTPVPASPPTPHTLCLSATESPCPGPGSAGRRAPGDAGPRRGKSEGDTAAHATPAGGGLPELPRREPVTQNTGGQSFGVAESPTFGTRVSTGPPWLV